MQKTVNSRNYGLVLFKPLIGPLSGATTPDQSGPGSDGNEGVLHIPQSSIINGASLSDCLVAYRHSLEEVLPVYSPSQLGNVAVCVIIIVVWVRSKIFQLRILQKYSFYLKKDTCAKIPIYLKLMCDKFAQFYPINAFLLCTYYCFFISCYFKSYLIRINSN